MWRIKFEKINPHSKLLNAIKVAAEQGGWNAALEVCRNTKGGTAAFAYELIEEFQKRERK